MDFGEKLCDYLGVDVETVSNKDGIYLKYELSMDQYNELMIKKFPLNLWWCIRPIPRGLQVLPHGMELLSKFLDGEKIFGTIENLKPYDIQLLCYYLEREMLDCDIETNIFIEKDRLVFQILDQYMELDRFIKLLGKIESVEIKEKRTYETPGSGMFIKSHQVCIRLNQIKFVIDNYVNPFPLQPNPHLTSVEQIRSYYSLDGSNEDIELTNDVIEGLNKDPILRKYLKGTSICNVSDLYEELWDSKNVNPRRQYLAIVTLRSYIEDDSLGIIIGYNDYDPEYKFLDMFYID